MKKAKRVESLFLAIAMCFSMVGSMGSAAAVEEGTSYDGYISAEETARQESVDLSPDEPVGTEAPEDPLPEAEQAGEDALPAEADAPEEPDELDTLSAVEEASEAELVWRTLDASVTPMEGLYDEWGYPTEALNRVWRFWHTMYDRDPALWTPNGEYHPAQPVTVKVTGWLPEGVTAKAEYIEYNESDIYTESALFAIELSLCDEDGSAYLPSDPVTITVGGEILYNVIHQERPVLVYVWRENAERAESLWKTYNQSWYAADVRAYRDCFGNAERRAYTVYDKYRAYEPGADAVRFTEDQTGVTVYVDNTIEFKYEYTAYDVEEGEALPLRLVISSQNPERTVTAESDGTEVSCRRRQYARKGPDDRRRRAVQGHCVLC